MHQQTARLIMYSRLGEDNILMKLSEIFERVQKGGAIDREPLVRAVYDQVYRILDLSTRYGFDENLWECYIAFLLATNENPFSIICETVGASLDATVNTIV